MLHWDSEVQLKAQSSTSRVFSVHYSAICWVFWCMTVGFILCKFPSIFNTFYASSACSLCMFTIFSPVTISLRVLSFYSFAACRGCQEREAEVGSCVGCPWWHPGVVSCLHREVSLCSLPCCFRKITEKAFLWLVLAIKKWPLGQIIFVFQNDLLHHLILADSPSATISTIFFFTLAPFAVLFWVISPLPLLVKRSHSSH